MRPGDRSPPARPPHAAQDAVGRRVSALARCWCDDSLGIVATLTERNSPIFHADSDFEVFVDAAGSYHHYKDRAQRAEHGVEPAARPAVRGRRRVLGRVATPGAPRHYDVAAQRTATRVLSGALNAAGGGSWRGDRARARGHAGAAARRAAARRGRAVADQLLARRAQGRDQPLVPAGRVGAARAAKPRGQGEHAPPRRVGRVRLPARPAAARRRRRPTTRRRSCGAGAAASPPSRCTTRSRRAARRAAPSRPSRRIGRTRRRRGAHVRRRGRARRRLRRRLRRRRARAGSRPR